MPGATQNTDNYARTCLIVGCLQEALGNLPSPIEPVLRYNGSESKITDDGKFKEFTYKCEVTLIYKEMVSLD
jgi:hypothetical protein